MPIGKELKRIRELNGLSASKFAGYIGVNADRLRKWESKGVNPKDEDVAVISDFFGVPIEELEKITKFKFSSKNVPREKGMVITKSDEIAVLQVQVKELTRAVAQLNEVVTKRSALDFYLDLEKRMRAELTEQANASS